MSTMRRSLSISPAFLFVLLFLLTTLSGLAHAQRSCSTRFRPVCCEVGGVLKTATNACKCKTDGNGVVMHAGACQVESAPAPVLCPAIYDPVCCQSGDEMKTVSNACNCESTPKKGLVMYAGECGDGESKEIDNISPEETAEMDVPEIIPTMFEEILDPPAEPIIKAPITKAPNADNGIIAPIILPGPTDGISEEPLLPVETSEAEMDPEENITPIILPGPTDGIPEEPVLPAETPAPEVEDTAHLCPDTSDPVCCAVDGKETTLLNDCFCWLLSGSVTKQGECITDEEEVKACSSKFEPVCCKLPSGIEETASNECKCESQSGEVLQAGECKITPAETEKSCSSKFEPVCCSLGTGASETYSNECLCEAAGGTVNYPTSCEDNASEEKISCPTIFEPVCCVVSGEGGFVTKANSCFCTESFGTVSYVGECGSAPKLIATDNPLPCTPNDPPVCCHKSDTGVTKTIANKCICKDAGATVLYFGACTF